MRHLSLVEPHAPPLDAVEDAPGLGLHVLIVEADDFTARLERRLLQRAGFRVVCVSDGEAGLRALTAHAYDAVITSAGSSRVGAAPWVMTTSMPLEDDACDRAEAEGAFTVAFCGDVVNAVLEALWELTPA
jgi:hypothetical protein